MANLKFLKGLYDNLSAVDIVDGQVLVCKDQGFMFVDVSDTERVQISDYTILADVAALQALDATKVPTSKFYYVEDGNILAKSNGTTWVQVNAQKTTEELIADLKLAEYAKVVDVTAELAKKADKSVVDAMYTNDAIDEKIKVATDAVAALDTKVGTLPTTTEAETVIAYIDEKTAGIASDAALTELTDRVEADEKALADYKTANDAEVAAVREIAEAARTETEVDGQIDAKIEALDLANTYDAKGAAAAAETAAKAYADGLITDANLDQYTTEQEVKDIVDGVIAGAADSETYNSLTKLVDYIDTHGGEATEMAQAIDTLEDKVDTLEKAPAAGIKATDIEAWNNEIGAKELAGTKTTTAEVKDQIEAYGYATEGYADNKAAGAQSAAEAKAAELDAALKTELQGEIDGDVATAIADEVARADGAYDTKGAAATAKAEAIEEAGAAATELDAVVLAEAQKYADEKISEANTWGTF